MSPLLLFTLCFFQRNQIEESLRVDYVVLDVVAWRGDQMVTDLTAADFQVLEGKKEVDFQLVETMEFKIKGEVIEGDVSKLETPDSQGLVPYQMVLALDMGSLNPTQAKQTFRQAENLLKELQSRPGVKIYIYDMSRGKGTRGFVGVVEALDTLDSMQERAKRRGVSKRYMSNRPDFSQLESNFELCQRSYGSSSRPEEMHRCINAELEVFVDQEIGDLERTIEQLEALTEVFQEVEGPKFIYFVSAGFSLKPGRAATDLAMQYTAERSVGRVESFEKEFRKVTHACIRNRIVFNTFDIFSTTMEKDRYLDTSLSTKAPSDRIQLAWRGYRNSLVEGMTTLADESGGIYHDGLNMAPVALRTIDRTKVVYVLGYKSPKGKKGKFRKIKVKCKRSGVKLQYRRGYFGR